MIIRPAALGDTLMLSPAVAQLRPYTEITLVGRSPGLEFFKPYVHSCIDYEGPGWHVLFLAEFDPGSAPAIPPVQVAVTFLKDPEGRVEANLKTYLPKTSVHAFPPFPPEGEKQHIASYLSQCLQRSGLPVDAERAIEDARKRPLFMNRVQKIREGKIVFHPGSGGHQKNHPPDFWIELIKQIQNHPHFKKGNSLLLLGPSEEPFYVFYKEKLAQVGIEILISPDRSSLISLLNGATLYMGQDSGITHLAAMHGVPTIALFKSSSIHQWKPLGPAVKVIEGHRSGRHLIWKILARAEEFMGESNLAHE